MPGAASGAAEASPETIEPTAGFGDEIRSIYAGIGMDMVRFAFATALINAVI